MEKSIEKVLLSLLKSAISGKELNESEKELFSSNQLHEMMVLSKKHDIMHLLALGLEQNGLCPTGNTDLELSIVEAVYRYERFKYEFDNICKIFEAERIPFMPLKGVIIRKYYPEEWMRTSCDIDILIHEEDLEKASSVLQEKIGYSYYGKTSHDISFITPSKVHIELHYSLIEEGRIKKASEVMESVWDSAIVHEGYKYRYEMSDEMFYFYHVAHMAKHFENGGCGIRAFIDLRFLNSIENANSQKRADLLKLGELDKFCESVTKLGRIWFDGEKMDSVSQCLEDFIMSGGVYGTNGNNAAVRAALGESKLDSFLKLMFLPKNALEELYPNLKRFPILLPFYQVKRWFGVFNKKKRNKIINLTQVRNSVTKEDVNSTAGLLELIGLTDSDKS